MKIRFTHAYKVKDEEAREFSPGDVVDVSEASANHFINRGVAELHVEEKPKRKKADG